MSPAQEPRRDTMELGPAAFAPAPTSAPRTVPTTLPMTQPTTLPTAVPTTLPTNPPVTAPFAPQHAASAPAPPALPVDEVEVPQAAVHSAAVELTPELPAEGVSPGPPPAIAPVAASPPPLLAQAATASAPVVAPAPERTTPGFEPAFEPSSAKTIARREVSQSAPDPYGAAIHALLTHLERVGFGGAPRSFGFDSNGRHLIEFIPGTPLNRLPADAPPVAPERIGAFLREMHDALESFEPPPGVAWFEGLRAPAAELIVHQDISKPNIVLTPDDRLAAIDWEAAGPGTRLWDLAHAAHSFAPLRVGESEQKSAIRLARLVHGYGLDLEDRKRLLPMLVMRPASMNRFLDQMRDTGETLWVQLWERGVGDAWRKDADWIRERDEFWRAALLD